MPRLSIILSCYNGEMFLADAIKSILNQIFLDWELIFVNDGSTDNSLEIAKEFEAKDKRIKTVSKENGGYVSARLYGLNYISEESEYLHFFDADDILNPIMYEQLIQELDNDPKIGAAYCNHFLMDENGVEIGLPSYGIRLIPTTFWMKEVDESVKETSFVSIFCWSCKMIEPMTIMRKSDYFNTNGWDVRFGKGKGNIGDGTLLFAELALKTKVSYLKIPLYYYRKHENQATSSSELNKNANKKVLDIWKYRINQGVLVDHKRDLKAAFICNEHRLKAYSLSRSIKHTLRFSPLKVFKLVVVILFHWIASLNLILYKDTKVFQ